MISWHPNAALETDAYPGSDGCLWEPPQPSIRLSYGRVDVWLVPLEIP